jgi:hypothetical protein
MISILCEGVGLVSRNNLLMFALIQFCVVIRLGTMFCNIDLVHRDYIDLIHRDCIYCILHRLGT